MSCLDKAGRKALVRGHTVELNDLRIEQDVYVSSSSSGSAIINTINWTIEPEFSIDVEERISTLPAFVSIIAVINHANLSDPVEISQTIQVYVEESSTNSDYYLENNDFEIKPYMD